MIFLFFIAGMAGWTLLEYVLHRFFHESRGSNHGSREHLKHHANPAYFAPLIQRVGVLSVIVASSFLVSWQVIGLQRGGAFALGLGFAYALYELLHTRAHEHAPLTRYGARVRERHFHHHFVAPLMNHGVSTALWDHVFGTYVEPERITVPRQHVHALAWVLDSRGEIDTRFSNRYALK